MDVTINETEINVPPEIATWGDLLNWVSICDVLEYEITPIVESWQKLVVRTREQLN